ncbi:Bromodomain and WD repeat-containing protein 1, partial [Camellia lanceoleosa]
PALNPNFTSLFNHDGSDRNYSQPVGIVNRNMALRKYVPSCDAPSVNMKPLSFSKKENEKARLTSPDTETDVDIDLREVYFLIMHFLSAGPCHRTYGQFWNELLEHQLLPRRYHAWYSRSGVHSGDENDDGLSFPLSYNKLVERYPHVEKDHLVKLLKQLILNVSTPSGCMVGGGTFGAASVPTLVGTGSFSLLSHDQNKVNNGTKPPPAFLRWPHMQADQVRGLSLREIGGGFTRHHRAPSIRAACYAIAKPSTMVQKMQNIKRTRGHLNSVYCAIFDRSGRYVITGSDDRLVKIWSMETAYCLASCRGHEGDITDLAVSSNNTLVASASNDYIIRVWRLPDGLPISVLRGHTGAVTAIAFSPRPNSAYQLLSSSDDGTCRIWDARYSQFTPRIYVPRPLDSIAGAAKNNVPSSSASQRSHQIFCCAFNANGTVFVTGSSDTLARVWSAYKSNTDESEPNHEIDILVGQETDGNYVHFRFNHDNIVTCSRDGSAIIWIPKSRRSHGKGCQPQVTDRPSGEKLLFSDFLVEEKSMRCFLLSRGIGLLGINAKSGGEMKERENGSWWEGRIVTAKPKSPRISRPVHGKKLEESGCEDQDRYGIRKMKQVSQKTKFVNRFPVPLTLEVIQSRLENNYYRNLEAMKHDISVMLSNAESYFERKAELTTKTRRLSDWFTRTLSSL